MRFDKKTLTIALIGLYLIGMIFTAYTLFNIEDKLIYDLQILDLSDAERADAVFYQSYVIIGASMIIGLLAIYYSFRHQEANVIYVEKTKEEQKEEQAKNDGNVNDKKTIDISAFDKNLKNPKPASEENLHDLISKVCKVLEASQGALYLSEVTKEKRKVVLKASYAMAIAESEVVEFEFGDGIVGQAAKENKTIYLDDVPEGYIKIISGLGAAAPSYLLVVPINTDEKLIGVVEIASFVPVKKDDIAALERYFRKFGEAISGGSNTKKEPELVSVEEEPKPAKKKVKSKKKTEDK